MNVIRVFEDIFSGFFIFQSSRRPFGRMSLGFVEMFVLFTVHFFFHTVDGQNGTTNYSHQKPSPTVGFCESKVHALIDPMGRLQMDPCQISPSN